jgi:hypothetical protein
MNLRTTLLLLLLAAGVGALVVWQNRREESWIDGSSEVLFAGVDISRIRSIRMESEERPPGVRFERDAQGSWRITDPISYPARASMITEILRLIKDSRAREVTAAEIAERDMPFRRLGILDVEEELIDGSRRITRLEIGDVELDGARLWVRKDGRILRTLRTFETMLLRDVHELRSDRILTVSPRDVIRLRREGVDLHGDHVVTIDFEAQRESYAWRMLSPVRAQIDPASMDLFLAALTTIRVASFVDDDVQALGPYGLASPQVRLILEDRHGDTQEAIFAQGVQGGKWYAHRPGLPFVWQADEMAGGRLYVPFEELLDARVLRVLRDDIDSVRLRGSEEEILLERDRKAKERRWTVAWKERDGGAFSMPLQADNVRVDDVLGKIESGELVHFLSEDPAVRFPAAEGSAKGAEDAARGVWVTDVHQIRQGGRIGERTSTQDGTPGWFYLREGDTVVSMVSLPVGELLELRSRDLLSRAILKLDEILLRRLTLSRGDTTRVYERSAETVWRHPETGFEAIELRPLLDHIFFLRASEHLGSRAAGESLDDPVTLEILDVHGETSRVTLGTDAEGRAICEHLGLRALLADPGLLDELRGLLAE